jgi:hypothetical protein
MSRFRLEPGQQLDLSVSAAAYQLEAVEHPSARGMVHSMEGGQAFVYHLRERGSQSQVAAEYAFKVMRQRFIDPALVGVCQRLEPFHGWDGLRVCKRACLSPSTAVSTLRTSPHLSYSMLMPWISGPSWLEIVNQQQSVLNGPAALALATRLAHILARLEQGSMAHCDLSAANLILDAVDGSPQLIDVEDMFGPGFSSPKNIMLGTPGYQHRASAQGQWGANVDRFSGAILLSEILAWHAAPVRAARYGESFFDPREMQDPASARFRVLAAAVEMQRPAARTLLERAWSSPTFVDCPTLAEWTAALEGITWVPFASLAPEPPRPLVTWGPAEPLPAAPSRQELVRWEKNIAPPPSSQDRQIFGWTPHPSAAPDPKAHQEND